MYTQPDEQLSRCMSVRGQVVAHLVNKVLNVSQYFWWGTQTNRDFNMLAALKSMTMNFEKLDAEWNLWNLRKKLCNTVAEC